MAFLIFKNANASCIRGTFISTLLLSSRSRIPLLPPDAFHKGRSPMQCWGWLLFLATYSVFNRAHTYTQDDGQQICRSDVIDVSKHESYLWAKLLISHAIHTSPLWHFPMFITFLICLLQAPLGKIHIFYTIWDWIDSFLALNALAALLQLCGSFQLSCLKPLCFLKTRWEKKGENNGFKFKAIICLTQLHLSPKLS